jgi:hypothetical protein
MRLLAKIGAPACLVALAAVGGGVANATPVTYTLDLSNLILGSLAPTSASFTYDASAPLGSQFTAFTVDWDGVTFDFTSLANSPTFNGTDCGTSANGSAATFAMLTEQNVCGMGTSYQWQGVRYADFALLGIQGADVTSAVFVSLTIDGLPNTASVETDQGTFPPPNQSWRPCQSHRASCCWVRGCLV